MSCNGNSISVLNVERIFFWKRFAENYPITYCLAKDKAIGYSVGSCYLLTFNSWTFHCWGKYKVKYNWSATNSGDYSDLKVHAKHSSTNFFKDYNKNKDDRCKHITFNKVNRKIIQVICENIGWDVHDWNNQMMRKQFKGKLLKLKSNEWK